MDIDLDELRRDIANADAVEDRSPVDLRAVLALIAEVASLREDQRRGGVDYLALREHADQLIVENARLRARRPVVCGHCGGEAAHDGEPCVGCGKDGCGPGVRYE